MAVVQGCVLRQLERERERDFCVSLATVAPHCDDERAKQEERFSFFLLRPSRRAIIERVNRIGKGHYQEAMPLNIGH